VCALRCARAVSDDWSLLDGFAVVTNNFFFFERFEPVSALAFFCEIDQGFFCSQNNGARAHEQFVLPSRSSRSLSL
jgi:hypothetical protein